MHEFHFSIFPNELFVDLGLYQFGHEVCEPGHSFGPAARNHYLFHFVFRGCGTMMADDLRGHTQTYHIRSDQGFMIFPGQITTYYADKEHPWEYCWVEFDGLRVREMIEAAGFSYDKPIYSAWDKGFRDEAKREIRYMSDHSRESPFHLIGHLYLFLDYLVKSIAPEIKPGGNKYKDYYIREAIAYIENHFQNDLTIEEIAESIGIDRSYFGKIFKQSMGQTPQHFLLNYRMTKAGELLRLTDLSVADVGNAVGYPVYTHFSRAFKNRYGIAPREWRRKIHRIER